MVPLKNQLEDTGWKDISLESGITAYESWIPVGVRKIGNVVHIRGAIKGLTTIWYTTIGKIPSEFYPTHAEQFVVCILNNVKKLCTLNISAGGVLSLTTPNGDNPFVNASDGIMINCTYFVD